ncbi:MAG: DUF808 domain-containing protein [Rhizobiaceae bacterium]|nr:DUF808 domain-containing protein [Rhizobiaceae bacterium]
MSLGLLALLDDIAALAKVAASSLDDIAGQAAKAGSKAAGLVIDDTAVAPRFVTGFSAARELPIIGKITLGSLRNKLLILLPAALVLSLLLPKAITFLLMIGGAYLSYEGVEKIYGLLMPDAAGGHEAALDSINPDAKSLEDRKVASAIKTDFILSAEIMAITLSTVPNLGFLAQAAVLAIVGVGITLGVYGAVAIIVKADDVGLALARKDSAGVLVPALGRGLVTGMPYFLNALGIVGTFAMHWVGGGIILHGLETYGVEAPAHLAQHLAEGAATALPAAGTLVGWAVQALCSGVVGIVVGILTIPVVSYLLSPLWRKVGPLLRRGLRAIGI